MRIDRVIVAYMLGQNGIILRVIFLQPFNEQQNGFHQKVPEIQDSKVKVRI